MSRDPDRESLTAFPTPHQLWAALRAGEVVARHAGRPAAELGPAFLRAPTEAVFSARDLEIGAGLLEEAEFVALPDDVVTPSGSLAALLAMPTEEACELLIDRLLGARRPLWVTAAANEGGVSPELNPDDAARRLGELFPDLDRREALLLALGRRFSAEERKARGRPRRGTCGRMRASGTVECRTG